MTENVLPTVITKGPGHDRDSIVVIGFLARYKNPTRAGYAMTLKQWFAWCYDRGISPLEAERAHIEVWARELEERKGNMASTVNGKLNAISGFYKFAWLDHYIKDNPAQYLNRPKVPRGSNRQALNKMELLQVLDAAQDSHPQDHALICVLAFWGLRIGEALALDVTDLGMRAGFRTAIVRREKNNDEGELPVVPRLSWALDTWLGSRKTGPVFLLPRGKEGQRMDRCAASRIIDRIVVTKVGITNKRITPHSFRHSHITIALNAGVPLRDLQHSMGYADARPLTTYDRDKGSLTRHSSWSVMAAIEGS